MARQASLSRVLVNDPALLLLDEPLGKLDSLTRMTLQDELASLWRRAGFTALLVTHDIEETLLLATHVVAPTGRPARIRLNVDKSYPREREDADLIGTRGRTLATLGIERPV